MQRSNLAIVNHPTLIIRVSSAHRLIHKDQMPVVIPGPGVLSSRVDSISEHNLNRPELPESRKLTGQPRAPVQVEYDRCRVVCKSPGRALEQGVEDGGLGGRHVPVYVLVSGVHLVRYGLGW